MKQSRLFLSLCAALVMFGAVAPLAAQAASHRSHSAAASKSRAKNGTHQFSGVVTAVDKSSLTVEKHGKKPMTMTFSKHAEMKVTGDLEKSARVTVYYKDEGGSPVAMRVVVKPQSTAANEK
jgi:hypothetical protein